MTRSIGLEEAFPVTTRSSQRFSPSRIRAQIRCISPSSLREVASRSFYSETGQCGGGLHIHNPPRSLKTTSLPAVVTSQLTATPPPQTHPPLWVVLVSGSHMLLFVRQQPWSLHLSHDGANGNIRPCDVCICLHTCSSVTSSTLLLVLR